MLENPLSVSVRSLVNRLNSRVPRARKVSCCCCILLSGPLMICDLHQVNIGFKLRMIEFNVGNPPSVNVKEQNSVEGGTCILNGFFHHLGSLLRDCIFASVLAAGSKAGWHLRGGPAATPSRWQESQWRCVIRRFPVPCSRQLGSAFAVKQTRWPPPGATSSPKDKPTGESKYCYDVNLKECDQAVHEDILGQHMNHFMTVMCLLCAVLMCCSEITVL